MTFKKQLPEMPGIYDMTDNPKMGYYYVTPVWFKKNKFILKDQRDLKEKDLTEFEGWYFRPRTPGDHIG